MSWLVFVELSAAFVLAFFISSLAEYVVHRLMHTGLINANIHADHHKEGGAQGWFLEFKDYIVPPIPAIVGVSALLWYFELPVAAASFAAGVVIYGSLAAYAHQLQHDNPDLCFWLPQPVHFTHHQDKMWHHNFGILVDFWDRVFGTYKSTDYLPGEKIYEYPLSAYFKIKWF